MEIPYGEGLYQVRSKKRRIKSEGVATPVCRRLAEKEDPKQTAMVRMTAGRPR